MHPDERLVCRIEQGSFCRHTVDRIWSIEDDDLYVVFFTSPHAEIERPNKSVITRADVLKIDK